MTSRYIQFDGPFSVSLQEEVLKTPGKGEIRVRTELCGISPGTERLLWRGEFPQDLQLDESIPPLRRSPEYPLPYGYALVGIVEEAGDPEGQLWVGRRVLALHPHRDRAVVERDWSVLLPPEIPPRRAVLLPHVETALTILHDAAPLAGETVVVFGLGQLGRLVLVMADEFPLSFLGAVDPSQRRREIAVAGTGAVPFASGIDTLARVPNADGVDLVVEVSGHADALQEAIDIAGYGGRIVVGSWYGSREVKLNLGSRFHRKRLRLESSQVSTIAPRNRGRWDHRRRLAAALDWLGRHDIPESTVREFAMAEAAKAYAFNDGKNEDGDLIVLRP